MKLIQSLFASKKFLAMLVGVISIVILKIFKVAGDPATIGEIVGLVASYIVSQGIADSGKEAAKINAVSANAVSPDADLDGHSAAAVKAIAQSMTPPTGSVE